MTKRNQLANQLEEAQKKLQEGHKIQALDLLKEIKEHEIEVMDEKDIVQESQRLIDKISVHQKNRKFRITVLSIFGITALAIVMLNFCRVRSTPIEARLVVDQICFKLHEPWELSSLDALVVGLSMADDLTLDVLHVEKGSPSSSGITWEPLDHPGSLQITRTLDDLRANIRSGYLNVSSLYVDSGAVVKVEFNEEIGNQMLLSIVKGAAAATIETADTVFIDCTNCRLDQETVQSSTQSLNLRVQLLFREISITNDGDWLELNMELPDPKPEYAPLLSELVHIDSIRFTKFMGNREKSTIIKSGSIFFPELNNKEQAIKSGDFLRIDQLRDFVIRSIHTSNNLEILLEGRVGQVKTGAAARLYSRLPTWLEWLFNNKSLAVIIGTLLPVFSFAMAILNRLNVFH